MSDRSISQGALGRVIQLVRVRHGSHLYGTSTPLSDQDFKGVHIPSGTAILLQRAENVIDTGVVAKEGSKNTPNAIDSQSFSIQKFFDMLMKGDTVATEILFAPPAAIVESHPLWLDVQATGRSLLNRECKGFVGYCVRQAAKYGIKGSRMASVKKLVDILDALPAAAKLGQFEEPLRDFAAAEEHAEFVNIPSQHGTDMWHIDCVDRKMPMTATIKEARDVYSRVWENYGHRSRAAMANEGIDWKAVSHAVRVARQAIELLDTGTITFPRPDAGQLLEIKQGRRVYSEVNDELEALVAEVHAASARSLLPERSNAALADAMVSRLHLEQMEAHHVVA